MKIGSLFDGSGGFPLAASMCGVEPVWAAEVEPYPIAVTRSRFPNMKHLGSVTDINGAEIEPVDIISFGAPCQDLSVAGLRKGLRHEGLGDEETTRSGLFMEAVRIIKEMREATNGEYPRYAIYENVPGAFSSSKGEDWRTVLEELIKIVEPTAVMPEVPKNGWPYADVYCGDGWSMAYRVLDAQYWGVPQRRRRIYLVADFRGGRAGKISFERKGLRGYFAQGGTPWKVSAGDAESGSGAADCSGESAELRLMDAYQHHGWRESDVCGTLTAGQSDGVRGDTPLVCVPYTLKIRSGCAVDSAGKAAGKGALIQTDKAATLAVAQDQYLFQPVCSSGDVAGTLDASYYKGCGMRQGVEREYVVQPIVSAGFKAGQSMAGGIGWQEECAATLSAQCSGTEPTVVYSVENHPADSRVNIDDSGKVQTLTSRMGTGGGNVPMVMEPVVYESHPMDSRVSECGEVSPTVTTKYAKGAADTPLVVEGAIPIHDQATRFSGKRGDNYDGKGNGLGVGEVGDPMNTLTSGDRHAVVYAIEGNGARPSHLGDGYSEADAMYTLNTIERHAVAYAMQGFGDYKDCGVASGLKARDYKDATDLVAEATPTLVARDHGAVAVRYIVRRLTPTECARLQGFPDNWGHPDIKESFTDEEYAFWLNARNTHAAINGKATKEYTREQMLTWYNKLHTDSSEYKMWGNGIALPCALYVMEGIVDESRN